MQTSVSISKYCGCSRIFSYCAVFEFFFFWHSLDLPLPIIQIDALAEGRVFDEIEHTTNCRGERPNKGVERTE